MKSVTPKIFAICLAALLLIGSIYYWIKLAEEARVQGARLARLATAGACEDTRLIDNGQAVVGDYFEWRLLSGMYCLVAAMDIPEWVFEEINNTRPIDGHRTESWDNFIVSWSFDGDKLSVLIRVND